MTGLHTSSLVVGLLCLLGAAVGAVALPGRGFRAPHEDQLTEAVPVPA
jgi:hypothetical protein